ncbi:M1 family metallopeptidase [Flavisolibacter tropicus]|uniref:Peptidase n=1 Tax=Flavisolibacter tropicus TaxID=1492898 RepID=A0A172U0D8_9BACT|nr:M1 family metallopeptidase [Flavisolibacter tropicus]ANE52815.1 peptidase [Flavisolibacter tropicus]
MKRLFSFAALLMAITSFAQQTPYWQQQVNYNIDVNLNDKAHTLKGFETIEYTNNSPDKLEYIWFHLWPNAYKNDSTAFAKQLFRESDGKKRWDAITDKGYIDSLNFKVNDIVAKTEADPKNIDIVKVLLPTPLAPGQKITITTPFFVKLSTYNSRSGHDGQSYMITQWYPKPAVYDRKGWHAFPYLDQGEFYSEFGTYKVNFTVPGSYVVGATGVLQTKAELDTYKKIGKENAATTTNNKKYTNTKESKTLSYIAENVHDFALFADKDFIIEYDTLQLASGKIIDAFAYHHPDGNKNWEKGASYVESAIRHYSNWLGEYPYPVAAAVEGPKNDMSGGMEYPMITLITSPEADEPQLDGVIAHEVGHNWFYGILASNEREHAWMDEGLNTYYQFRYEAELYKFNSVFGNSVPNEIKQKPVNEYQDILYYAAQTQIPMEEAIDIPAGDFKSKEEYGLITYLKTAVWLHLLEQQYGKEKVDKGMQTYFNDWKFKHPYPEDLKLSLEKAIGQDLTSFFAALKKKGNL